MPFTAAELNPLSAITTDTLGFVTAGQHAKAATRATDLETAWDDAVPVLQKQNPDQWTALDGAIDKVLTSVRAEAPDAARETSALTALQAALAA